MTTPAPSIAPDPPLGVRRPSREAQALAELGHTRGSTGVPVALAAMFVLSILSVPAFEASRDPRGRLPVVDLIDVLPGWERIRSARSVSDVAALLPSAAWLRAFESRLALGSHASALVRPTVQWAMTRWLGVGSDRVIAGKDGWLYYRDGFDYVTGEPFLSPDRLRRLATPDFEPDPRKAIVQFHRLLADAGVQLIVVPVPDKAMARPESLRAGEAFARVPQNPSWPAFVSDLRAAGVTVLDLGQTMRDAERGGAAQFLRGDSHWSPAGADEVARAVADAVRRSGVALSDPMAFGRRSVEFTRVGDLAELLNLPAARSAAIYPAATHTALQVFREDSGEVWRADPASRLVVIGDSFGALYSMSEAGPAVAAGLGEQISYHLQQRLSLFATHRWGALGPREALGTNVRAVREAVAGKRIVIWEFAIRKLTAESWPLLPQ